MLKKLKFAANMTIAGGVIIIMIVGLWLAHSNMK